MLQIKPAPCPGSCGLSEDHFRCFCQTSEPLLGIDCVDVIGAAGQNCQRFDAAGRLHAGNNERLAKRLHPHRLVIGLQLPKQPDVLGVVDGEFGFVSLPRVALLVEAAGWPLRSRGGLSQEAAWQPEAATTRRIHTKESTFTVETLSIRKPRCQSQGGTGQLSGSSYHDLTHFHWRKHVHSRQSSGRFWLPLRRCRRRGSVRRAAIPWYIWVGVLAITSSSIGGAWDVSWHRSIGRDTFWTPAHMAIYACGVLAGIICAWLIARCTFGHDRELTAASVSVFGLRAPLGIFLAGWGCVAMLTSAPFDNWWHNAYGLDVKIVSPPHALLILGLRGISTGVMFLILAAMNRAAQNDTGTFKRLQLLFLYVGGLAIVGQMFFVQEYTWDVKLHQAAAYIAMGIGLPLVLRRFFRRHRGRAGRQRPWLLFIPLLVIAEILILPLFPAQPKLGPVFNPVTHLIPAKFPILILVPALALDLLWQRVKNWKPWQIALVSGVLFMAVLTAVEWPFANFLLSDASKNRFFGTIYFDYNSRATGYDRLREWFFPIMVLPSTSGYCGLPSTPPSPPGSVCSSAAGCAVCSDEGAQRQIAFLRFLSRLPSPPCSRPHREQGCL